ncbi:MAG: hypothetical protein ACOCUU_01815 [Nanoarchaeota archaeon]
MQYFSKLLKTIKDFFNIDFSLNKQINNPWIKYLNQEPLDYLNVRRKGNSIITTFKDKSSFLNWAKDNYVHSRKNIQDTYSSLIQDFNNYSQELYKKFESHTNLRGLEFCLE